MKLPKFDFFQLEFPYPVPKRRLVTLYISLILSATLISGTVLISNNINATPTSLYENSNNILVLHDTTSSTPFTSHVSTLYLQTINRFNGILNYSPEILQPALFEGRSALFRGVDYPRFKDIAKSVEIVSSTKPIKSLGLVEGLVSLDFKQLHKVSLGGTYSLQSALTGRTIQISIIGFFKSSTTYTSDILINIKSATFLGDYNGYFTHIQIKYDNNKISKDELRQLLTRENRIQFRVSYDNGTLPTDKVRFLIYNSFSNPIVDKIVNQSVFSIYLPVGMYRVTIQVNDRETNSREFTILKNESLVISTNQFRKLVEFNAVYKNTNLQSFSLLTFDENNQLLLTNSTAKGRITQSLLNDQLYNFGVLLGSSIFKFQSIGLQSQITFNLTNKNIFSNVFPFPTNFRSFSSEFIVELPKSYQSKYILNLQSQNGTQLNQNFLVIQKQFIYFYNLNSGKYVFSTSFNNTNGIIKLDEHKFEVILSKSPIETNLFNYSSYNPDTTAKVKLITADISSAIVTLNNENVNMLTVNRSSLTFRLPHVYGFYQLSVELYSESQGNLSNTYYISISPPSQKAGWMSPDTIPSITNESTLYFWSKIPIISSNSSIMKLTPYIGKFFINSSISVGNYFFTANSKNDSIVLPFQVVDYSKIISFKNSTNGKLLVKNNDIIKTDNLIPTYNSNNLKLFLNSSKDMIQSNVKVDFPTGVNKIHLNLQDKLTGSPVLSLNFTIISGSTSNLLLYPKDNFRNESSSNIFKLDGNFTYDFKFLNGTKLSPIFIGNHEVILPPTFVNITIFNSNYLNSIIIKLGAANYQNRSITANTIVSTWYSYIVLNQFHNLSILPENTIYTFSNQTQLLMGYKRVELNYNATVSKFTNLTVVPNKISLLRYKVLFPNGTLSSEIQFNHTILFVGKGNYTLFSTWTDTYGFQHNSSEKFYVGVNLVSYNVKFMGLNRFPSSPLLLTFKNLYEPNKLTTEISNGTINLLNIQSISNLAIGSFSIDFSYNLSSTELTISLNYLEVRFNTIDKNFNRLNPLRENVTVQGRTESGKFLNFTQDLSVLPNLFLPIGTYNFSAISGILKNFKLNQSETLNLPSLILNSTGLLKLQGVNVIDIRTITLKHNLLSVSQGLKFFNGTDLTSFWIINKFPIGNLSVTIILNNGKILSSSFIWNINSKLTIITFGSEANNQLFGNPNLLKLARNNAINLSDGGNYANSFLQSFIILLRVSLIVEIIVITFIVSINIYTSFDFFITLSKKEFDILKNQGFSETNILVLFFRSLFVMIFILSTIGYVLGFLTVSSYINYFGITLYGNIFKLEFFNVRSFLTMLVIQYGILVSIIFIGRRLSLRVNYLRETN